MINVSYCDHVNFRAALMQQSGQSSGPARETDRTAELDNLGILEMQQDVMQEQDLQLEQMEQSVASTRVSNCLLTVISINSSQHIALTCHHHR